MRSRVPEDEALVGLGLAFLRARRPFAAERGIQVAYRLVGMDGAGVLMFGLARIASARLAIPVAIRLSET